MRLRYLEIDAHFFVALGHLIPLCSLLGGYREQLISPNAWAGYGCGG